MLSKSKYAGLLPVKNMGRAIKFYTGKLDATVNMRGSGEMKEWWASISIGKTEFWLTKPEKSESRKLSYNAFMVKNIRATVKGLKSRSVKFEPADKMPDTKTDGTINFSAYGASAFFRDSEGNLLMVMQPPKM